MINEHLFPFMVLTHICYLLFTLQSSVCRIKFKLRVFFIFTVGVKTSEGLSEKRETDVCEDSHCGYLRLSECQEVKPEESQRAAQYRTSLSEQRLQRLYRLHRDTL